jgi:hypothetical protein
MARWMSILIWDQQKCDIAAGLSGQRQAGKELGRTISDKDPILIPPQLVGYPIVIPCKFAGYPTPIPWG